jgi:UDP-N-acetylglucosamine diphosphorylase/glucosamine-1-phosphate N-acetyltransferase
MKVVFFEDQFYRNFEPLSLSHPVYMLLLGTSRIYTKWVKSLGAREHSFLCRPYLAQIIFAEIGREVNTIPDDESVIYLNGRFIPSEKAISAVKQLKPGEALVNGETLMCFSIPQSQTPPFINNLTELYNAESMEIVRDSLKVKFIDTAPINYLWEMISLNGAMIKSEFAEIDARFKSSMKTSSKSAINIEGIVAMASDAKISPNVVIDTTDGPVIIDKGVVIDPLTYVKGPCYIGPNCRIVGGKIREGCSFGPVCRIGGEIEESIMLGYCNKYHEGFLGHSYLGEWVNLGAMTTNSDLKNNYAPVKVISDGKMVDTGQIKVGCFIGDHTKTGIGTLLNTGISIGFSCNLYGGGLFGERQIGSFSWGTPGNLVKYELNKAVQTATNSMSRREIAFAEPHTALFEGIFKQSIWSKE